MAISLTSDIVSEVVRAADPARYQAATQRLTEPALAGEGSFAEALGSAGGPSVAMGADEYDLRGNLKSRAEMAAASKRKATLEKFEAAVLQTFIETMLPKSNENSFGKGSAGNVWRSMMAEQLGAQMAKAGGLGIAAKLLSQSQSGAAGSGIQQGVTGAPSKNVIGDV